ncbi:hypothetical protein KDX00_16730 [Cobetia amphilecti]|nr:hypothetical protein KDX00_16730 [Cobetia litoralis]
MYKNPSFIFTLAIYLLLIVSFLTPSYSETPLLLFLLILQAIRFCLYKKPDSLVFSLGVIYFTLYALPTIGIILFENISTHKTIGGFIIFSDILIQLRVKSKAGNIRIPLSFSGSTKRLFFALQLWMLIMPFIIVGNSLITLLIPLSISAVILEIILIKVRGSKFLYVALGCYTVIFSAHLMFHWSGFGRLVIGTYITFIFFIVTYYYDLKFRLWQLPLLLPIALFFAQVSRYGEVIDFRTLLMGSAGHHLIITHDAELLTSQTMGQGWADFFDQIQLLLLGWFPRFAWENKPLGAGLTSVDTMYGREGLPDNYTQSLGFMGEQYYLLGDYYWLGLTIIIILLLCIRYLIAKHSAGFKSAIVAFDVSLLSFFWGGMGIFGNRVWFLLVPCFLYIILLRCKRNNTLRSAV